MPVAILDTLLADVDLLTTVLTYHVTAEAHYLADPRRGSIAAPTIIDTLQGQSLTLGFKPGVAAMVN